MRPPAPSATTVSWQDLDRARQWYAERLDWPVTIDREHHRVAVRIDASLDAITLPAGLGRQVLRQLRIAILAGPVLVGPGPRWWTLFTQPLAKSRLTIPAELRAAHVSAVPRGSSVALPADPLHVHSDDVIPAKECGQGPWCWVTAPEPCPVLPPWSAVMATARRVCADRRTA